MPTRSIFHIAVIFTCLPFLFWNCSSTANTVPEKIIHLNKWYYLVGTVGDILNSQNMTLPGILNSEEWKPLSSTADIRKSYTGKIVWIKTKLPDWNGDDPSIYIGYASYNIQVFYNDKLIYQVNDFNLEANQYLRWHQELIHLPNYTKGNEIIFKIKPSDKFILTFENVIFGSTTEIIRYIFKNNFIYLILISIIFIAGAAAVIIYLTLTKTKLLIYLLIFLFSAGVVISVNNSFLQLVINIPVLFYHLNYIFLNVSSVYLYLMIEMVVLIKYKIIINVIWKLKFASLIFIITILSFTNLIFNDILKYYIMTSFIFIITANTILFISISKSEFESRILYAGIIGVYSSVIIEIIFIFSHGINNTFGYKIKAMPFGLLIFVGTILWYAIHDYMLTVKEKEMSKKNEFEAVKRENETRFLFAKKLIDSQESERNRIAMGLHDSIGQKMLLVKNLILSKAKKSDDETEKIFLNGVNDLTGKTINEIRNIIYDLRPQHLDQLGLSTAIETLVENLSESSDINFVTNIDKIDNCFTKSDEINFFRIVQECLNNIIKHSNAKDALINIQKSDEVIIMMIKDNGKNSKENKNILNGIGLIGIRERSRMIGAELSMDINGQNGSTVALKYPIKKELLREKEDD